MTNLQHDRLEQLFSAALQLGSASDRARLLDRECGDDLELRSRITDLLKAHERVGSFLDTPRTDPDATRDFSKPHEAAGTLIGRYRIIDRIGEGGFGSVFKAEQEEPVRRTVALKIIKLGMDTKDVIARFEAERQALALMDHPNIAHVYDAGATETGRPYFVMELVDGVAIHKYCDDHRLTTRERLELFLPVCQAVQHAHQKGIIHRDLKPNNVLVMLREGKPIPKVIDFGIAKATSQRLTDKTLQTGFREFVGTPEYMSPDQTALAGADVDTRTDIYSLGVLLYELITSRRPLETELRDCTSLTEIVRIIRETEPPKPSVRWLNSAPAQNLAELAERRRSEPRALTRRIRGDLDWIVMKAMEKNRERRYDTAKDLADDVERHLEHLPISASAPGVAYKCGKFFRRHRVGVLSGTIVVVTLVAGFALATIGLIQANSARSALKIESEAAKRAHATATATNKFLQQMLAAVDPDRALGREVSVRYVLDEAAKKIHEGALAAQPEVEATVRMTLGETYEGLGAYATAESQLTAANDLCHRVFGDRHAQTLRVQRALAGVLRIEGKFSAAEALLRRTAEMQSRTLGESHPDTLASMNELALALSGPGRFTEAESIHRRTLEIQKRVLGSEHPDCLSSIIHLGSVYRALGKFDLAETQLREALTLCGRVLGDDHPQTAKAASSLGLLLEDQHNYQQAEDLFRRTYELDRRILGPDHPRTMISMNDLLRVLGAQGKVDRRRPLIRERLAQLQRAAARPDASASDLHACAWELLNSELGQLRDHVLALPLAQRAVEMDGGRDASMLETLATAQHLNGSLADAIDSQRQALARARLGGPYNRADLEAKLTRFLIEQGDLVGATAVSWQNLASRLGRTFFATETPGASLIAQADDLMAEGRFLEAAAVLRGCLGMRQKDLPEGHWLIADTQSQLGEAVARGGKLSEAEPILIEAHEDLKDNQDAPAERQRLALERIVWLYQRWDKIEQTTKWRQLLDRRERPAATGDSRTQNPPVHQNNRLLSDEIRGPQQGMSTDERGATIVEPLGDN